MAQYTVNLNDAHERALEHLRFKDGGGALSKPEFVQHYIVRALENHALQMKDQSLSMAMAMNDEDFADLPRRRQEAKDAQAKVEAARQAEIAAAEARKAEEAKAAEALMEKPQ